MVRGTCPPHVYTHVYTHAYPQAEQLRRRAEDAEGGVAELQQRLEEGATSRTKMQTEVRVDIRWGDCAGVCVYSARVQC